MSTKSKGKKPAVPREMDEIQKDCNNKFFQSGQLQYQIKILSDELTQLNEQLRKINHEGAARKQLDAQKPAVEDAPQPQAEVNNVS